ncbi:MAG: phosphatase PAP2 family protein [Methyloversatilis discipulorum]|uniref:phosphatase PAP2 family protein n=1 Tax=Methyloversatilis discipulorum TaxID=1119528 RepID=UPI0026ED259C|nr:phosphatase PAP2 family protein [Methyloversatilis discipulorum]MBT9516808.1 phosphatase PAP2 family protein [Methyloversatilis discipulorum]
MPAPRNRKPRSVSRPPIERPHPVAAFDASCVQRLNRLLDHRPCLIAARAISRLGDGEAWLLLIALLAVMPGGAGMRCALHLLAVGAAGLLIYGLLKRRTARRRPCVSLHGLHLCMPPLDEFSFPSGHTLHATSFALVALHHLPALGLGLLAFAVLTALVRVMLGLHYPSDVVAGAVIGAAVAVVSRWLLPG